MTLVALATNKDVNQSIVDQVVLAVERAKLSVKRRWLAAALWRLIVLNPIRLASNLVKAVIDGHVPIPNGSQFTA